MTHTPADELRAAAKKLRLTAGNATEGAWAIWRDLDYQGYITVGNAAGVVTPPALQSAGGECNPVAHVYVWEDAQHIALMHPRVGLAVADWLDAAAADADTAVAEPGEPFVEPAALVVARRVLGETTTDTVVQAAVPQTKTRCSCGGSFPVHHLHADVHEPLPEQPADLRDRIAQALADADGWVWAAGFDKTQSPSYQGYLRQADAVMAVLPTGADQPADRRARYRAAIRENDGWVLDDGQHMLDAVMAVADAEQQELRAQAAVLSAELTRRAPLLGEYAAQMANLRTMYDVADGRANDLIEERDALRAEVERLRADRATVRTAIRRLVAHAVGFQDVLDEGDQGAWGKTIGADIAELRRLADEAQQPAPAVTEEPTR